MFFRGREFVYYLEEFYKGGKGVIFNDTFIFFL